MSDDVHIKGSGLFIAQNAHPERYVTIPRAEHEALLAERDQLKSQVEQLLGAMKLDGRFLAQHEALMAAAKMLYEIEEYETLHDACKAASTVLAALRAAGIQIEDRP